MYNSPIEICRTVEDIIQKVNEETDNQVYEAVFRCGVNVDKDELIKALQYDREQYAKGYADGAREFAERLKTKQEEAYILHGGYESEVVQVAEIDNAVKELEDYCDD